ncbi:FG-GAP repeat domain-containing protein [Parahaliea mediterranea]|uniref:VCBS repeat-containing protein n=1 Tax=Parahaliea mediterranea TaxID=651086 RepID=A0A939DHV4_9GAMM|nr:VCBS repeat-containing protein [Parahaliea mediterranea]MBN7797812.1 VCBS repeat-containing protein [Parahaliea mediterranea]
MKSFLACLALLSASGASLAKTEDVAPEAGRAVVKAAAAGHSQPIGWREHWIDDQASSGIALRGGDGLVMADLDGDGHPDIVSVHEDSHHVRIAFGGASPDLWRSITLAEGESVAAVEDADIGDLDGDGDLDLVIAMESGALMAFLNPGDKVRTPGNWRAYRPQNTLGRGSFIRVALADVDGDGRLEVIAANKGEAQAGAGKKSKPGVMDLLYLWFAERRPVSIFTPILDRKDDTPWPEQALANLRFPINAEPVDLDGDGDVDIVAGGRGHQGLMWLENRDGAFHPRWLNLDGWASVLRQGMPFVTGQTLAFADMNGDGRLDILTQLNLDRLGWLEQPAARDQAWTIHAIGALTPDHIAAIQPVDVDGDGNLDVFVGGYSKGARDTDDVDETDQRPLGRLAWFRNTGNAEGWERRDISRRVRGMYDELIPVDLDRDGDLDIVGTRGNSGEFDGVFWLEQRRGDGEGAVFASSRKIDSPQAPLSATRWPDASRSVPQVERLLNEPIISPALDASIGANIQGPSLIRVPDWVQNPLGKYYLYFADHKGHYIRLAYADALTGPWRIYRPGTLQLRDTDLPQQPVSFTPSQLAELQAQMKALGITRDSLPHDPLIELTTPHIASPDVHVDATNQRIVMYFHGLKSAGYQVSRVATSQDGLRFTAGREDLGKTYMRAFEHKDYTYALAMPGQFYRSRDGLTAFEKGPLLFGPTMRHAALLKRGDELLVFWTRVGEAPERILLSRIDLSVPWMDWTESEAVEVLRPEKPWEGADAPLVPSQRSVAYGQVNQLRDPAIFEEDGKVYLLYAVAGESGIAIAQLFWPW